jgi:hypothetical protein
MKVDHEDCSTRMNHDTLLQMIFPTQDTYRAITRDILVLFEEAAEEVEGRRELEVSSVVSKLQENGHNRHTVYKLLREHLVPMGVVNWKKFEGSIQLSTTFGNALRNMSVSWKNFVSTVEDGDAGLQESAPD